MQTYEYTARNTATGQKVKSQVQAENEQTAAKLIRDQGFSPLEVRLQGSSTEGLKRFTNRIRAKDKILFSRQLSTLINAGLPLIQSLRNVSAQTQSKPLKVVIDQVISDVEGGAALSAALSRHPEAFNRVFISMVAAGESSGTLDKSLERLANQQEKDAEIISKVRGAMIYPAVVITVMIAVVGFMIVKVLPQVEVMYRDLPGASLPLVTRMLLAVSHFTSRFWWVIGLVLIAGAFFGSRWARTGPGREFVDRAKLRMWPIGQLFQKMYMARFARTGATLVGSGVPLLQMLDITGEAINNVHVEAALRRAAEKVKGGKALSDSLQSEEAFLQLVPNMLRIGEQSGAIEAMMEKIADYYEREVDTAIRNISSIIEPVLMVILGVFAFIIVAAVLLPIYSLAGQTIIR
ncbi:MAG TPA: type II secretion system F family protein [Candidatus Saccharibacteria bacterium]|nr:type II secretion system F family protein [Candidatus Saccharibacteria bacterium]